ncbi:unnamed protein product [Kuraishia capsulata CBS 1993]|uniref:Uncharacterized protein n=1 Tax=Kuraishia capsulata CBS 1993 TaxID=1382522 RepID=W6MLP5_9ASCO|nr:uncharacterized protein KUCA_T00003417001 [Kuraishia capsulata CBS 1993]CDK27439.1 unnamed protein product [Kuraishia capsulata CBS 1993]
MAAMVPVVQQYLLKKKTGDGSRTQIFALVKKRVCRTHRAPEIEVQQPMGSAFPNYEPRTPTILNLSTIAPLSGSLIPRADPDAFRALQMSASEPENNHHLWIINLPKRWKLQERTYCSRICNKQEIGEIPKFTGQKGGFEAVSVLAHSRPHHFPSRG